MKYIVTAIYTMIVCHFLRKIYQVMVGKRPKPVAVQEPQIRAIYRGPVSKEELGKLMEEFSIVETQESPVSFTGSC